MLKVLRDNIRASMLAFLKRQMRKAPRLTAAAMLTREFINDMSKDNVGLYAAQSAFFTMLSAVPFLMFVILCLKYFIHVNVAEITMPIRRAFPEIISSYISKIISEVFYKSQSVAMLSATVITILWSSSRGTMAVYSGFNMIFGRTRRQSWLFSRIASFFYNITLVAVITASICVLVFGSTIASFFDKEFALAHYVLLLLFKLRYPLFFALFVLGFAALYTFLPQRRTKYRSQIPGAAATALGWVGFSYGFSIYIMNYAKYSFLYGSLTAIVLLMLWVYICVYLLLIGAEINKHIENGFFRRVKRRVFYRKRAKGRIGS